MPIISDGNNEIGDQLTDNHTVLGSTEHSGSYHLSGTDSSNILTINNPNMTLQMSTSTAGHFTSISPTVGVFEDSGLQPTIAVGRVDNVKDFGGQLAFTRASLTGAVGNGDILGTVASLAHDGTDFVQSGQIRFVVDGTVATDRLPTKIELMTNPGDGTTVFPSTRMTINANGNVGIGTFGQSEKLSVNGDGRISGQLTIDATSDPTITFRENNTEKATIGVNSSDNILIENKTTNKHIVFKVNDQGVVREGLRLDGAVPEVVVNQQSESLINFRVESDNNTHMLFVTGSGKVGIGTDSPDYTLDVAGDIGVDQYIYHNGDENTHINFAEDRIILKAGNKAMITVEEKDSTPHEVTVNDGGNNIDFIVENNSGNTLFRTVASRNSVIIGADAVASTDTNFFVSGSTGSRGTTTRGTALFGGDLVVSGTLSAIQKHICTAKYTMDSADKQFIRFNAAGSNSTAGVNNKFVAPSPGSLSFIMIRSTGTPGQTAIGFHRSPDGTTDINSTPVDTQNIVMNNADTSYKVLFTQAANFGLGDIVGLSVDPAANHGNVDITLVFELDFVL